MLVSVATSVTRGRPRYICTIVFEDTRPSRARFFPAPTAGWQLDTIMDSSSSLRAEMYEVRAAARATGMTLQMSSTHDGDVVSATMLETK